MRTDDEKTSEGLQQLFEMINAKGDVGELKEIVERSDTTDRSTSHQQKNKQMR